MILRSRDSVLECGATAPLSILRPTLTPTKILILILLFPSPKLFAASATIEVPRWQMHEFSTETKTQISNPFADAALIGEFISPSGKTNIIHGFYDGEQTWRLRFAPNELGEWRYQLRGEGVEISQHGTLRCTPAQAHGFIRINPHNPYTFAYDDGTPFFPMGDTCYGLVDDTPITPAHRAEYLKTRRSQKFNFVRMHVSQSRVHGANDPTFWPWGGSPKNPDLDRLNPKFFQHLDSIFREMRSNEMNVELILLNYYQPPINNPKQWTPDRNRTWLRYITARYAAFDNLFMWTLANEYEVHPDGQYRLDFPADVEWTKETARQIHSLDPCQHLFTVHPVISASRKGDNPRAPLDPPWRIGEFFGAEKSIDVLSQQTASMLEGARWDETLKAWTGDDKHLVASLRADRRYNKPVLNTEFGYEYLRGAPTEKQQVHHTDKVRRAAWRIVMSGGYIAAGFNGTIGHSDVWNRLDPGNHYDFKIQDEGAAKQLGHLYDFLQKIPFTEMAPMENALGLTNQKFTALYFPAGGKTPSQSSAKWFNPRTGQWTAATKNADGFSTPDSEDWALLIENSK